MISNRKFKKTLQVNGSYHSPLGMRSSPPYGISEDSEPIDALLNNASIYTLENLKNNPELLRPLNPTVLPVNDFDAVSAIEKIVDWESDSNEPLNNNTNEN